MVSAGVAGLPPEEVVVRSQAAMIAEPALRRIDRLAGNGHPGAQALSTYFVGQGVGLMNKVKPAREVVLEFIEDYVAAAERLSGTLEG